MKVDLKRELKHLYSAPREPSMVDVPGMAFLMIDGHGNPNTAPVYAAAVEARIRTGGLGLDHHDHAA